VTSLDEEAARRIRETDCLQLFHSTARILEARVGIELLATLKTHKLLISRDHKSKKTCKSAQPRYTRGTRKFSTMR
jgi:hypothetical protein